MPDAGFNDQFGRTVAIEGNVVIIGAPRVQVVAGHLRGAVYVYRFDGNAWSFEQKLQPNLSTLSQFGRSIAANNGELLIAGDYSPGSVFVFRFDGTSWSQIQLMQYPGISASVAAAGDWAVAGKPGSNALTGSAAIFHRERGGWVFHSQITAGPAIGFGNIRSLAIDDDWIVVGSPVQNISYRFAGIVRAFQFDGANWVKAMDMGGTSAVSEHVGTQLGASVAIYHNRVLAVAPSAITGPQTSGLTCIYPLLNGCDEVPVPDPCSIVDCNHNQIPDSCEIASAPSSDCNRNSVPDECESTMIYKVDDGTGEQAWGSQYNGRGYDFIWLNQFEVVPGMEVIDRLSIMWPSQVGGGFPVTFVVYRDQNNDGDPHDGLLLRAVSRWTKNTGNGNQPVTKLAYEPIGPTYLGPPGQKFFVGVRVSCIAGTYPISVDNTSLPQHRGWSVVAQLGHSNIQNIAGNPDIYAPGVPGSVPGNFAIRALVTDCNLNGIWDGCDIASGTSLDVNANGIPDECEHCRADLAPPGGNGTIDVDDLVVVLNHWSATGLDPADVNVSGEVNVDDLLAVINSWGACA